jgi:DNA repair protein RadC
MHHNPFSGQNQLVIHFVRAKLAGLRKEAFLVIYLNTRNETIDAEILANGTVDQVVIHTRELLAEAIKRSARGIILVHNHPGGSVEPSADDRLLTESIRKAGSAMRIDLLDHLVITHDAAYSIAMEQRIELGNEDFYHLQDEGRQAAETKKQNYDKLPFRPRKIRKTMTELTGKAKKKGDVE